MLGRPRISVAHVVAYQLHALSYLWLHLRIYLGLGFAMTELWLLQDNPLPSVTTSTSVVHHGSSMYNMCRSIYQIANILTAINRPAQRPGTPPRPLSHSSTLILVADRKRSRIAPQLLLRNV